MTRFDRLFNKKQNYNNHDILHGNVDFIYNVMVLTTFL